MAKTATDLLDELAQKDLVPTAVVASLRSQVAKAARPVPAQQITKLLVEKGHLTPAQAQKLLGGPAPAAAGAKAATATATKAAPKPASAPVAAATKPIADDLTALDGLEPLESLDGLEPLAESSPLAAPAPAAGLDSVEAAPLDALGEADLLSSPLGPDPLAAAAAVSQKKPMPQPARPPAAPRSPATTALLALNGVALIGVLAAAAFAFIPRANGDAEFQAAEGEYAAKNYAAAAEQYQVLLDKYPQHRQAGLARVHQGLAKMHLAAGNSNWPQLLPVAKQVLAEIDSQPQLTEAQAELAPLISSMAVGLAEQAVAAKSAEQIAAARQALALADNGRYAPGHLRPWQKLSAAKASLAVAEYQLAKDVKLQKSLATIKEAVSGKKLNEAQAAREELLAAYPELDRGPALTELGKDLAAAALAAIQKVDFPGQPATDEGTAPTTTLVGLEAQVPVVRTILTTAAGQLWAFDLVEGVARWRRPIGGHNTQPVRVGPQPDADAIAIDSGNDEVIRLTSRNGAMQWRRAIKQLLAAPPQIAGSNVIVATKAGLIIALDAASGRTAAAVQLPVGLRAAPLVSGSEIFVVGDSLFGFTLKAGDLSPQSAVYLGHAPASTIVVPTALPQHKIVVENRGIELAALHVLDDAATTVLQELPISGFVLSPPVVLGSRLVMATGKSVAIFEMTADTKSPLKKALEQSISATYVAGSAGKLLVGGAGLQQCDLALSGRTLEVKPLWTAFPTGVCLSPPQATSDAVFCIRREPNSSDSIAAAVRAANGQPLWETRLALPEAAP